jgi:predicted nuclease of predicted toxin-antitoxin system
MKILLDQGTPVPLRKMLSGHHIDTAYECGWQTLENGDLISTAEAAGYELLITTDQNLRYQQNLSDRSISIVVLTSTSWPRIRENVDLINEAIAYLPASSFVEIEIK